MPNRNGIGILGAGKIPRTLLTGRLNRHGLENDRPRYETAMASFHSIFKPSIVAGL